MEDDSDIRGPSPTCREDGGESSLECKTREITVMFTDLKGSTSIAEQQGDISVRMLLKKHEDILTPIIKNNHGILVKTMGDGTMSYFGGSADAVASAILIQQGIDEYNRTAQKGMNISIRIGINSGTGIVEENDIFGDVVNVASRFESIANPGEIYMSESAWQILGPRKDEFCCHFIKKTKLKGKKDEFRVFKVFWRPLEIRKINSGADPVSFNEDEAKVEMWASFGTKLKKDGSESLAAVSISAERIEASKVQNEIPGQVIKTGQTLKLNDDSFRILGNLIVEPGGTLSAINAKLYFEENAGVVVLGTLKAKSSLFTAIDPIKRWLNVTILSASAMPSVIDACKFNFGKGISWKALSGYKDLPLPGAQETSHYGGGLFVYGGTDKTFTLVHTVFYKCIAHAGGGLMLHSSKAIAEGCLFDGCMSTQSGGGLSIYAGSPLINDCTFNNCTTGRDGGGAFLQNTEAALTNCMLRGCMAKLNGGGIAAYAANSKIQNCRFERCVSSKQGGGLYADNKSKLHVPFPSYSKCKPEDVFFSK